MITKRNRILTCLLGAALLALAYAPSRSQAQTILTNTYTFTFDTGGITTNFDSAWIYWYDSPGGNTPILCDPTMDASNNPNSGSLFVVSPLAGYTQNIFFGTFAADTNNAYDFSVEANLLLYSNISFDVLVAPDTPLSPNGDYGGIGVGIISANYGYEELGYPAIPASAATNWFHIVVPIDKAKPNLAAVPGIALDFYSYGGYPLFTMTNWIDNISVNTAPAAAPPPPPTMTAPTIPIAGLNCIATTPGDAGAGNRYQIATVGDTGYAFVGQPTVTYSWTIKSFPTNDANSFQQHFFIVNGSPGQYEQAADYSLADCIFVTVQADTNGGGLCSFRYKTNEPAGGEMLFNVLSPTDPANTNSWPVMPVATLDSSPLLGTWSLAFEDSTNVTITSPNGAMTNFVFDPASAALFADPVTLLLGVQPNAGNFGGQEVVYSSFSVTGNAAPFNDNFLTDAALNTNTWNNFSEDTNGVVLVPPGSAYWLGWTLPAPGYVLVSATNLTGSNVWSSFAPLATISDNGQMQALITKNSLAGARDRYFAVVQRAFTQLLVLLPGETNAPNTPTGKIGTPVSYSLSANLGFVDATCTVLAVDGNWNPIPGITDIISITDSGGGSDPNNAALVNGAAQFDVFYFSTATNSTITAADASNTNILSNTSSQFSVTP